MKHGKSIILLCTKIFCEIRGSFTTNLSKQHSPILQIAMQTCFPVWGALMKHFFFLSLWVWFAILFLSYLSLINDLAIHRRVFLQIEKCLTKLCLENGVHWWRHYKGLSIADFFITKTNCLSVLLLYFQYGDTNLVRISHCVWFFLTYISSDICLEDRATNTN